MAWDNGRWYRCMAKHSFSQVNNRTNWGFNVSWAIQGIKKSSYSHTMDSFDPFAIRPWWNLKGYLCFIWCCKKKWLPTISKKIGVQAHSWKNGNNEILVKACATPLTSLSLLSQMEVSLTSNGNLILFMAWNWNVTTPHLLANLKPLVASTNSLGKAYLASLRSNCMFLWGTPHFKNSIGHLMEQSIWPKELLPFFKEIW